MVVRDLPTKCGPYLVVAIRLSLCFPPATTMSDFTPAPAPANIAPGPSADGTVHPDAPDDAEPQPITDHEVGEYREQDRYLPVRLPVFSSALFCRLIRMPLPFAAYRLLMSRV